MTRPGFQERTVLEVAAMLKAGASIFLLDVREPMELEFANLGDGALHVPMSELAKRGFEALPEPLSTDRDVAIIVMCHHGIRSAQVAAWLGAHGWTNVFNMTGGIDAYARLVDPGVGLY